MFPKLLRTLRNTDPASPVVAALLVGVRDVAILQNVLAHRDPQLAILYTLVVLTLALIGGGRFLLDARLEHRYKAIAPTSA